MEYGLFTKIEVERVSAELGFEEFDRLNESVMTALQAVESQQRKDEIISTLDEVDELESTITEYIKKAYIEQVDTIRLKYLDAVKWLMREASRKLNWAARLANLEPKYDRFTENTGSNHSVLAWY